MISRVTLLLEDGTQEDISDQLARHNVVSVGWIMDQIEGAAARSDATFTAVYDEQGTTYGEGPHTADRKVVLPPHRRRMRTMARTSVPAWAAAAYAR